MKYTNEYLFKDMIKRNSGVIYGETQQDKIKALKFKEYAKERGYGLTCCFD